MVSADRHASYVTLLDPELRAATEAFIEVFPDGYELDSLEKVLATRAVRSRRRATTNADFAGPEVPTEDRWVPGHKGAPDIRVRLYSPPPSVTPTPAVMWVHGGGFVMGDLDGEDIVCARMAHNTGALVVSVDYRLAPEHTYPDALHDCLAVYQWLVAESPRLGVDPAALVVGGTSAGGAIVAALCHVLRDLDLRRPLLQVLAAPALDDRSEPTLSDERIDAPPFNRNLLRSAWTSYLGSRFGEASLPPYAAAARATDLSGLPTAYISVGALDPLLDENLAYARRLIGAGVKTEVHVFPGAGHGFESFAPMAALSQRCLDERETVVRRAIASAQDADRR